MTEPGSSTEENRSGTDVPEVSSKTSVKSALEGSVSTTTIRSNDPGMNSEADAVDFILNGPKSVAQSGQQERGGWLLAFTRFHQIPVFRRVGLYLLFMTLYTVAISYFMDKTLPNTIKDAGAVAYGSLVLGLLLVFRTNTAYERWSEGRKLWGQLVNDSRNFCFKIRAFVPAPELERIRMGQLVISFAYALKHHLRNTQPSEPLPGLGRSSHEIRNLPVHVAGNIFDLLKAWKQAGYIDTLMLIQLDYHVRAFMDVCGACERIKNSPIAISYRAFLRQGIMMNLLIAPLCLKTEFPLIWCLPMILIGTYFLIGLELIAEDIEEPFGKEGDDLPLDTICATIRTTVTDILHLHRAFKYTRTAEMPIIDPLKAQPK